MCPVPNWRDKRPGGAIRSGRYTELANCASFIEDEPIVMSQPTSSRQRRTSQARKNARSGARPNRAQLRAAEIRAAESGVAAASPPVAAAVPAVRQSRNRAPARVIGLSREAEMGYQRADLKRLLYTAGVLFVLMIVLLFILD